MVNKKIKLDRYIFYNDKNYKDFIVKVKNKMYKVKGMVLVKDDKVEINFGIKMGDLIDKVINKLGENYKINKVGKNYYLMIYVDCFNKLKLNILYKDNIVKRIEFFSK